MEVLKQGLSNIQIKNYLENDTGFIGCFPSNKIPEINSIPCTLIINTAQSGHPGDHWVALHLKADVAFYFDSFGFPIIEDDIFKFLKKYYKKYSIIESVFKILLVLHVVYFVLLLLKMFFL